MELGLRLTIIIPSLLFLIGFSVKSILVNKFDNICKQVKESKLLFQENLKDYFLMLGVDALIVFMANGFIIIFQLELVEGGIILIVTGVILSLYMLTGVYAENYGVMIFSYIFIFTLIMGEFGFLMSGNESFAYTIIEGILKISIDGFVAFSIGFTIGIFVSVGMLCLAYPDFEKKIKKALQKKPTKKDN